MKSGFTKNAVEKEDNSKLLKQLEQAKRENEQINAYYHKALQGRDHEISVLKYRMGEFLETEVANEKKYQLLRDEYDEYQTQVKKLMKAQTDKAYHLYELEKKQNLLLEEKIRVLTATIANFREEQS